MAQFISILYLIVSVVVLSILAIPPPAQDTKKLNEWLLNTDLEQLATLEDVTLQKLENLSLEEGAQMMHKLYHLSQMNHKLSPSFVPSPSNIPVYLIKSNGEKRICTLSSLVSVAKQQPDFGKQEVTVFITGMPSSIHSVDKANTMLVKAYLQRYNRPNREDDLLKLPFKDQSKSSEEEELSNKNFKYDNGDLVIIDLGSTFTNLKRFALLDVSVTGAMIAHALLDLTKECHVPLEIMHIVAQGIACHVAGAAGNEYTRLTGQSLRRITALDPSKLFARDPSILVGLSRGDAEFIDAIHTSVYGMGTMNRVGDIDFFPNGPSVGAPGSENIIDAAMRATLYYAESLRPGNEHNFPAVEVHSLKDYKRNNGFGKRIYMGIEAPYDLKGDYMMEVNAHSPFGKRAPAQKQLFYHGYHDFWTHDD